ncbi:hypothetical protein HALLA_11660 [Halostagnicola larsenii XH-48]|uniref:Uncharacterized protein n=1 Tax=Halostagnicola larsenii XH-48 TaxID=797299 RepID=W0JUB7_9EURY|nr:hypothetical protein HALLA_11660 [Halostagnicola larsenii XH-48]
MISVNLLALARPSATVPHHSVRSTTVVCRIVS